MLLNRTTYRSRRRLRRRVRRSSRRALALGGPARRARAGPAGRQHGSDRHIVMSGRFSMQPTCLVSDAPSRGHRVNSVDAKGAGVSVPAGDDALCGGLRSFPRVKVADVLGAALIYVFEVIGDDAGHALGVEYEVPVEGLCLEVPPCG